MSGSELAGGVAAKAPEMAAQTVEIATKTVPDKMANVINALNKYAAENNIPFKV